MAFIRRELVNAVERWVINLIYHTDVDKRFELRKQAVLAEKSLTNEEKSYVIEGLTEIYDDEKVRRKTGIKRVC